MEFKLQEIDLASKDTGPYGIAVSDKGEAWYTQHKANKISCIGLDGEYTSFWSGWNYERQRWCTLVCRDYRQ